MGLNMALRMFCVHCVQMYTYMQHSKRERRLYMCIALHLLIIIYTHNLVYNKHNGVVYGKRQCNVSQSGMQSRVFQNPP